ncbi:MAG: VCBS repeat-containing protein, partial [Bacteroidota bacterium]
KIVASDFDQDGQDDLIVVGEWTTVGLFRNESGKFRDLSAENNLGLDKGWWFTIEETDVNNDDLPDYIIGNVGLNTKYKASKEAPLKIFADDFDDNGTWDIVLSSKYKDKYVPFRGKQCSSEQMPFITRKFPTYDKFAKASLVDVYGERLNNAYQREVTEFRSVVLVNKGQGQFEKRPLPMQAQLSPLLSCQSMDVNKDGFLDIVMAGNIYNTEVETPRFDAGTGSVLLSDGAGNFTIQNSQESGLYVDGNIKSMRQIQAGDSRYLLFGRNDSSLALVKLVH